MGTVAVYCIRWVMEHSKVGYVTLVDVIHDLIATGGYDKELVSGWATNGSGSRVQKAIKSIVIAVELIDSRHKAIGKLLDNARQKSLFPASAHRVEVVIGAAPAN
ncbi:MAG TPA: hypothetical protein VM687_16580 [Stenotrophomonas sp.]|nr:hypothetical protein [Stenotrophomonas sp.]